MRSFLTISCVVAAVFNRGQLKSSSEKNSLQNRFATFPKDASPPLSGDRLSFVCRSTSSLSLYVHAYLYGSNVSCICGMSVSRPRVYIATASRERMPIVPRIPRKALRPMHDGARGNTSVSSSLLFFSPAQSSCPLIMKIKRRPIGISIYGTP